MERKAIILVAGMGTRLKPLTLSCHKCLTKVNGVPILFNTLESLCRAGVAETVLVVGYMAKTLKDAVGSDYGGMKITYAENTDYARTNTSYSLLLGLQAVNGYDSLLVLEGDVLFEHSLMNLLLAEPHRNVTMLEQYRPDLDGSFVQMDEDGYVVDWTHKSMREPGYTLEDKYKTVNIHRFEKVFVEKVLLPFLLKSCDEVQGKEPFETIMRGIVRKDHRAVYGILAKGYKWYEIDDQNDLAAAESVFKEVLL